MDDSMSKWLLDDGSDDEFEDRIKSSLSTWGVDYSDFESIRQRDNSKNFHNAAVLCKNQTENYRDNLNKRNLFLDGEPPDRSFRNIPVEFFMPPTASWAIRAYGINTLEDLLYIPRNKILQAAKISIDDLEEIEKRIVRNYKIDSTAVREPPALESSYILDTSITLPSGKALDTNLGNMNLALDLGVTSGAARKLKEAGYEILSDLAGVSPDTLYTIKGIGPAVIWKIRHAASRAGVPEEFWDLTKHDVLSGASVNQLEIGPRGSLVKTASCSDSLRSEVLLSSGYVLSPSLCNLNIENDLGVAPKRASKLRNAGIEKVSDLAGFSKKRLLSIGGFSAGAIEKLAENMVAVGIPSSFWNPGTANIGKHSFRNILWRSLDDEQESTEEAIRHVVGEDYRRQTPSGSFWATCDSHGMSVPVDLFTCRRNIYSFLDCELCMLDVKESYFEIILDSCNAQTRAFLSSDFSNVSSQTNNFKSFLCLNLGYIARSAGIEHASQVIFDILDSFERAGISNKLATQSLELERRCPSYLKHACMGWFNVTALDTDSIRNATFGEILESASTNPIYFAICEEVIDCLYASKEQELQATSYYQLFCQALLDEDPRISAREMNMTAQYLHLDGQKVTLQDLGERYGITRERVRQVIAKRRVAISFDSTLRFHAIRMAVYINIWQTGGSMSVSKLRKMLSEDSVCLSGPVSAFLRLDEDLCISSDGKKAYIGSLPCTSCLAAASVCEKLRGGDVCLTNQEFAEATGCSECCLINKPSLDVIATANDLYSFDGILGEKSSIPMRAKLHPDSDRAVLHTVLYEANRELSYDEMIEAVVQRTGKIPKKNKVSSQVGSFEDCMLWGKGTYIHERNAPWPKNLLKATANRICNEFQSRKIPIICVEGVFDLYEPDLTAEGISTRHALFSLLRKLDDSRLELREYPWICDREMIGDRTSFAKYFYSVLEQNNGFITDAHAYAIADRTMAQSFALGGLAEYSPHLINANGGWYDIEAAGFDMDGIAKLVEEIAEKMGDNDIISTVKVFEDNRERCLKYGVKSYDILYYLVDLMEDDLPIEASRKPHLIKAKKKHMSVKDAVISYITGSDTPVSKLELIEEFKVRRGINTAGICTPLLVGGDIILVGDETYWSREKLHIDDEFVRHFDEIIKSKLRYARKQADLFYARREILPDFSDFPSPQGLTWNSYLLKTVFESSGRFHLYGENGSCVIDTEENPTITNAEAFYGALLENEFMGWTPFDRFVTYCNAYSIRSNLEPEFFDAFSSIRADEISIMTV